VEEGSVIQSASQNVSGGTALFVMATLSEMQVRTLVDETDMGALRAGMSTQVVVEAYPDRVFNGRVQKIEPKAVVQQNVTMFPVIVSLDNSSGLLKPGMNAEVEILIDQANDVLLVPNNAVVALDDVGPASMVLGLDLDEMDLASLRSGGRFGGTLPPGNGTNAGAAAPGENAGGDARARLAALRAQVESGEISQDSLRTAMRALIPEGGFGGRAGRAGQAGQAGGAEAGQAATQGQGDDASAAPTGMMGPQRRTTRAVLFVMNGAGVPEPRLVELGLNDWDRTQIVSGVEEGEQIALIGAAQLMARQQEFLDRIRERGGSSPFGGGGMGGGMGRGR
jgi:HlyD family secretion protein